MSLTLIARFPDASPLRVDWPSDGQLRRKLEIAEGEGDAPTADLMRRLLHARGQSPGRPLSTAAPERKARRGDPETSRAAAVAAAPRANTQKARLLEAFAAAPDGLTASAASELAHVTYVSCSTRCTELVRDGFLTRTGRTRPTENGSPADVLVIAADALKHVGTAA